MQHKSLPTLQLVLQTSARLQQFIVLVHILALAACLFNALAITYKLVCFTVVVVHFWHNHKRLNNERYEFRHNEATGWQALVNGQFMAINILNSTVITTFAIFLHFKYPNGERVNIVIPSDALANDVYRQFIVRLKTTTVK